MKKTLIYIISAFLSLIALPLDAQEFLDAVKTFNNGDFKKARTQFLSLTATDESDDASFYYIGLCDVMLDDAAEAELFFKKAVDLDPANFWYKTRLAELFIRTERVNDAVLLYESLLADYPKKTDIYYNLVNLYARQSDVDKLLKTLDEIESISGKSEQVTLARYDVLMRLNKAEEAFAALKEFNEEYSSSQVLAAMGDYELSMDRDSLALVYYDEALSCDGGSIPALLGKAEIYRLSQRDEEYFNTIGKFTADENVPPQSKIHYLTSLIQRMDSRFQTENIGRVDSLIRSCIEVAPDDYDTRVFYAQFLAFLENWPELLTQAEEAFSVFPEEVAFLEMKNLAYYNLEDYEGLIRESERILTATSDTTSMLSALATIGDTYHLMGERKKAYAAYEKALKINAKYVPVLNNYAYYLSEEGKKLNKAYAMSKITVEEEPDNATYLDTFGWILFLQGKALEAKPFFKHAMLYGGKDNAVILEHYAAVLRKLKEDDLAKVYESMAAKLQQ